MESQTQDGILQRAVNKLSDLEIVKKAKEMISNLGYTSSLDYLNDANQPGADDVSGQIAVCDGGCVIAIGSEVCEHGNPGLTSTVMGERWNDDEEPGDIPETAVITEPVTVGFNDGVVLGTVTAETEEAAVAIAADILNSDVVEVEDIDEDDDDIPGDPLAILQADLNTAEMQETELARESFSAQADADAADAVAQDLEVAALNADYAADVARENAEGAAESAAAAKRNLEDKIRQVDSLAETVDEVNAEMMSE